MTCDAYCAFFRASFYWAEADDADSLVPAMFTYYSKIRELPLHTMLHDYPSSTPLKCMNSNLMSLQRRIIADCVCPHPQM